MNKQANDNKGQVITFYSYKGGTGRSMALANVACLLVRDGHRVLMIDWDMEAPGLSKYFRPYLPSSNHQRGLIDFMEMANEHLPAMEYDEEDEAALRRVFEKIGDYLTPVEGIPEAKGELFLLKSGDEHSPNYPAQISHFDWEKFFLKIRGFFFYFARHLAQTFDYVLIDSRTGHTDTGGICTMMMPEKLVLVFTPNRQSYDGITTLARKATDYRRSSDDMRPLRIYPLPSRIELGEEDLRQDFLAHYRDDFRALIQEIYNVSEVNFDPYMTNIQIRHSSKFAYQEKIAVLEERIWDKDSLSRVYRNFTDLLEEGKMFWSIDKESEVSRKEWYEYGYTLEGSIPPPLLPNLGTLKSYGTDKTSGMPSMIDLNNLDENHEIHMDYDSHGNVTRIRKVRSAGCSLWLALIWLTVLALLAFYFMTK